MPALVTLARDNVLEYLLSSSRLADLPKNTDWQLDTGRGSENQFHFCSDNWRMVIWPPDSKDGVQRVILINKPKQAYWSGYVTSDGRVVDTAYYR